MASSDLENGSSGYSVPNFLLQSSSVQNVSELENLYTEYYPRNAKERPFKISRMMILTWEISNAAQQVSRLQTYTFCDHNTASMRVQTCAYVWLHANVDT